MDTKAFITLLEKHESLAVWAQASGVIFAIAFGAKELQQATEALKNSAKSNEIMVRNGVSDLFVKINEAALANPDLAGDYPRHKRLHLMRLYYFYQAFSQRESGFMDDDLYETVGKYLLYAATLPDFKSVWHDFHDIFPKKFQKWVDQTIGKEKSDGGVHLNEGAQANEANKSPGSNVLSLSDNEMLDKPNVVNAGSLFHEGILARNMGGRVEGI